MSELPEKLDELKSKAVYWREILARPVNEAEVPVKRESQEAYAAYGYRGILTLLSVAPLGYELAEKIKEYDGYVESVGNDTQLAEIMWDKIKTLARQIKEQADEKMKG